MNLDLIAYAIGGIGIVMSGVTGLLLWRSERARSRAKMQWLSDHQELLAAREALSRLRIALARKDKKIHELQEQMVSRNPGAVFDSVFGGMRSEAGTDKPETD